MKLFGPELKEEVVITGQIVAMLIVLPLLVVALESVRGCRILLDSLRAVAQKAIRAAQLFS